MERTHHRRDAGLGCAPHGGMGAPRREAARFLRVTLWQRRYGRGGALCCVLRRACPAHRGECTARVALAKPGVAQCLTRDGYRRSGWGACPAPSDLADETRGIVRAYAGALSARGRSVRAVAELAGGVGGVVGGGEVAGTLGLPATLVVAGATLFRSP